MTRSLDVHVLRQLALQTPAAGADKLHAAPTPTDNNRLYVETPAPRRAPPSLHHLVSLPTTSHRLI